MAKRKSSSAQGRQRVSKSKSARISGSFISPTFQRVLYACGAGLLFYLVRSVLLFKPAGADTLTPLIVLLCAGLAWWGSSVSFSNHVRSISNVAVIALVPYLAINVGLSFDWLKPQAPWNYISYGLAVPFAVLWIFILKTAGPTVIDDAYQREFSFRQVFSHKITWLAAAVVFLICGVLIFYRLGYYDIWEDENLVINASIGISEQGFSYLKEGYDRAWLHSMMNAAVFKVFGVSEFTGRLWSAIFGLVFVGACFYVFARWYGLAWLAILVPLVCLMNDQFLMLFRYMRMYALWIPLFLLGTYFFYRLVLDIPKFFPTGAEKPDRKRILLYAGGSIVSLLMLFHLHKLSAVLIPALFLMLIYRSIVYPSVWTRRLLIFSGVAILVVAFGAFVLELDALRLFRQAVQKASQPGRDYPVYFEYMFRNGFPANCTFLLLISGIGLLLSNVSRRLKSILILNYSLIGLALYIMAFVLTWSGRDYRYIAHLVPLVVSSLMWILYLVGKHMMPRVASLWLVLPLLVGMIHFSQDYKRVYVRHPWAPRYSMVYQSFLERFKPGDALFYPNIKTYYFDPEKLEGVKLYKTPKQKQYTMKQFRQDLQEAGHGYIMWEWHKGHHWREEIVQYIYRHFKPIHTQSKDDLGVELFYFDESMIQESN